MWAVLAASWPIIFTMMVPFAIPVVGVSVGALVDRIHPRPYTPAEAAVTAAKARAARWREENERLLNTPAPPVSAPRKAA